MYRVGDRHDGLVRYVYEYVMYIYIKLPLDIIRFRTLSYDIVHLFLYSLNEYAAKAVGLPETFLAESDSGEKLTGGGVIQVCTLDGGSQS